MRYDYQKFFEEKLRELAKEKDVLDVGGGRPIQKYMAPYKSWFDEVKYQTLDVASEYSPTIVGDVHNLPLKDESVSAILCNSVLEHLHDPPRAVEEMRRVLKKGGKILIYTHFIYPYHARKGVYKDYFRFTEDAFGHMFGKFSHLEIKKQGGYFRALMFFMPFQARLRPLWEPIAYFLDKIFKTERKSTTAGYYLYAIK